MKKSFEHNIDEIYKDAFTDAEQGFDKDAMWENVRPAISPDKYRPLLLWLSLATSILLVAYFLFSFSMQKNTAIVPAKAKTVQLNENLPAINSSQSTAVSANSTQNISPPSENGPNNAVAGTIASSSDAKQKSKVNKKEILRSTEKYRSQETSKKVESLPGKMAASKNSRNESKLSVPSPLKSTSLSVISEEKKLETPDPKWSHCDVRKRPRFFSEFYGLGAYPLINNSLNLDPSNDYNSFLQDWNSGESAVGSYAFGVMFGVGSHWGGSLSVGLEFQQVINKILREQTVIERVTVFDEMAYYYLDSNNNRVWVADSVTSTRIYTREVQAAKRHTIVNAPILLGYHFELDRWRFGVTAGVNIHLFHYYNGKTLDQSGQIIDAETGTLNAVYDKELGVSIIGGLEIGYLIASKTELYFSPRFRYNPKSWLNPNHPLESRIQLPGARAGIRWHF
jgi:hypothetical protein